MTVIANVVNVSKSYGGIFHILQGCSLEVQRGQRLGIVGPNGAGKSTLLRMLAGLEPPDEGAIWLHPGLSVGFLHQEPEFAAERTLIELALEADPAMTRIEAALHAVEARLAEPAVYGDPARLERVLHEQERLLHDYELAGGAAYRSRVEGTLQALGIPQGSWAQPAGQLSGGQKKLLGLARLLVARPDLLLLDEPDNHLDVRGKQALEQLIHDYPGTVLVISHDRHLLDVVVEGIVEVTAGTATLWHGNYSEFAFEKNMAIAAQQKAFDLQEREIARMEAAARRLVSWSNNGQNEKMIQRARNMLKRVERMEKIEAPIRERNKMGLALQGSRGSDKALEARALWMCFEEGAGTREVLAEAELLVWSGEVVGLVGPNGAGKSVLFRLIQGELEPTAGELRLGPSTQLAAYHQEHATLDPERTLVEEIRRLKPMYEGQAYHHLGRFGFSREEAQKAIRALSGGEKSRLQFARLMLTPANFLLLDEPTNHLDIPSAEVLEGVIAEYEGTVLVISHDRYFLERIVTRIVELRDGQLHSYPGRWADFLNAKQAEAQGGRGAGKR